MNYSKGTIVKKRNIKFKPLNKVDFRMNGHPIIFPVDFGFDDNHFYYFTLSSQVHHYTREPARYYMLPKMPGSGLRTPSIVDLKYIYKCDFFNTIPEGEIPEHVNKAIIHKFSEYEGLILDNDCKEFLAILERQPS